jgi:hypothetical protein
MSSSDRRGLIGLAVFVVVCVGFVLAQIPGLQPKIVPVNANECAIAREEGIVAAARVLFIRTDTSDGFDESDARESILEGCGYRR